jgi:hypothetical protein
MLCGVGARKIFRGWRQSSTNLSCIHRAASHVVLSALTGLVLLLSGLFALNSPWGFDAFLYQVASRGFVSGTQG